MSGVSLPIEIEVGDGELVLQEKLDRSQLVKRRHGDVDAMPVGRGRETVLPEQRHRAVEAIAVDLDAQVNTPVELLDEVRGGRVEDLSARVQGDDAIGEAKDLAGMVRRKEYRLPRALREDCGDRLETNRQRMTALT
jgi:hypothetical protein